MQLKIYTATSGLFLECEAEIVTLPGVKGDIGINSSDRVYSSILAPGIAHIIENGTSVTKRLLLEGGSVYFKDDCANIMVYEYIFEIDSSLQEKLDSIIDHINEKYPKLTKDELNIRLEMLRTLKAKLAEPFHYK